MSEKGMTLFWPAMNTLNEIMALDGFLTPPWLVLAPKACTAPAFSLQFYWQFFRTEIAVASIARKVGRVDERPVQSKYAVVFDLGCEAIQEKRLTLIRPGGYLVVHALAGLKAVSDQRFELIFERLIDRRSDPCQSPDASGVVLGWYVWRNKE